MHVIFGNKHLEALYEKGSSPKFKGLQKNVLKKYMMRIQAISAANTYYDLWHHPSYKFEKLNTGKYSIRVDGKWRLEFTIDWEDDPPTKGQVTITNLSNHYGD